MGIIRQLTEKPWLVTDRVIVEDIDESAFPSAAPTGLRVYFVVATVMFSLIAAMYLMRMGVGHPGEGLDWRSTPKPWLLWVNTAILILSSVAFQRTRAAARRGQMDRVAVGLLTAGFFAFALGSPQTGEAYGGAQFQRSGLLVASQVEGPPIAGLRFGGGLG